MSQEQQSKDQHSISTAEAIKWAGSGAELARRLKIKPQAIYQWGKKVPKLRGYQIREMQRA